MSTKLNPECLRCKVKRYITNAPVLEDLEMIDYIKKVSKAISEVNPNEDQSTLVSYLDKLYKETFGDKDYSELKPFFNNFVLEREKEIEKSLDLAEDKLLRALQISLVGNYIDFQAFDSISTEILMDLINKAKEQILDKKTYEKLKEELSKAKEFIFITDNCGEIVLDKILIKQIQKEYPHLHICAMVRGGSVVNDASLEDAKQIGLFDVCEVIDNGTLIAGTNLKKTPQIVLDRINRADVLIAKGQANVESLDGCGLNLFYLFLCKCAVFAKKYNSKEMYGILHYEKEDW